MKTLNALACTGLEQLADGMWQRHSQFSQAVNFVHADGTLLTLFRYGKGIGPTGILFSSTEFAQLDNLPRLVKQGRLLWGGGSRHPPASNAQTSLSRRPLVSSRSFGLFMPERTMRRAQSAAGGYAVLFIYYGRA
ncbi:hypothetical protein RFC93_001354 [Klebsiella aerogenes]